MAQPERFEAQILGNGTGGTDAEVSKDGRVRSRRVVCAVDCATVINSDTVRAQIEGAMVFGIAATLYERLRSGAAMSSKQISMLTKCGV
jgi:CO/xanthine dehydrogenase Mo-binding subunit